MSTLSYPPPAHAPSDLGSLVGKRITLCVTGSIAAYKAVLLVRLLKAAAADVQVVMTRAAKRFVGRDTLAALTGRLVATDMFGSDGEPHVELARRSDLIVVAPASADSMARLATGRGDDLLAATILCARCPVLIAPAMHPSMWEHPLTRANVERLASLPGWRIVGPAFGKVASGDEGWGRMLEPADIAREIAAILADGTEADAGAKTRAELAGRHVVVTAGPTVEDLDPVRSLTNRSSGRMGFAIAGSAVRRGARVTLIAGPVSLPTPDGVRRIDVRSALDMQAALSQALGERLGAADALVMCAAVSDYRPRLAAATKLKRSGEPMVLELVPNPDLLSEVGSARSGTEPLLLGFAVETASGPALVALARQKLASKHVDAIVANAAEDALGTEDTRAILVTPSEERPLGPGPKTLVSEQIVDFLVTRLNRAPGQP